MCSFKDIVAQDNVLTFINFREFAELHNLNGTDCLAIVDNLTSQERFLQGAAYSGYDGMYGKEIIVYCNEKDLPEVPAATTRFDVDGEIYLVDHCDEEMGILKLTLKGEMIR